MRVAYVPLDSRPPNWQFPQRLAEIGGIELLLPPREWLGTLRKAADGKQLATWLVEQAPACDAAIFSWDALIYGGLVQSRQPEQSVNRPDDIARILAVVNWSKLPAYGFAVIPRLGISVLNKDELVSHELVREYFELSGNADAADRLRELEGLLGPGQIQKLWTWRSRNQHHNLTIARLARDLPLRHMHYAMEDNARRGPHLKELGELKRLAVTHTGEEGCAFSYFDGTDEVGCLLLALAAREHYQPGPLNVQLTVLPKVPGADRYTGRFESHSLGNGLVFLSDLLGINYLYEDGDVAWLVLHGVQPQPDAFAGDPGQIFNNPYLLPRELPARIPLFVSDLAACNGANPKLAHGLLGDAGGRLISLVGFNTNFNTLGVSAALMSIAHVSLDSPAITRFLVARLADDVVYQSIARPRVMQHLARRAVNPMDFSEAQYFIEDECLDIVRRSWRDWLNVGAADQLQEAGINPEYARALSFSFPWQRAFEIEVLEPGE